MGTNVEVNRRASKRWAASNRDKLSAASRRFNWRKDKIINADGTLFSMNDYKKSFEQQNGRCNVCGKHQDALKKALSADHDHVTGLFRGLLCFRCNAVLGLFGDDPNLFQSSIQYLNQKNSREAQPKQQGCGLI